MAKVNEVMSELCKPFAPEDIEWRIGRKNKEGTKAEVLAYTNARAVQERLDEVIGAGNWDVRFSKIDLGFMKRENRDKSITEVPLKGFACEITLRVYDDVDGWTTISREDVSQCTDFEPIKGGASGAFKRAASMFGIGRYLYKLPLSWVPIDKYGNFTPPDLPEWALPEGFKKTPKAKPTKPVTQERVENTSTETVIKFNKGKYEGQAISNVSDKDYLNWVANKSHFSSEIKKACIERLFQLGA